MVHAEGRDASSDEPLGALICTWGNSPFYGWTVTFTDRREPLVSLTIVGYHTHSDLCSAAMQALVDKVPEGEVTVSFLVKELREPSLYNLPERFVISPDSPDPALRESAESVFRRAKSEARQKIRSAEAIPLPSEKLTIVAADASVTIPPPESGEKWVMGVGWVVAAKSTRDGKMRVHTGSDCFIEDQGSIRRGELYAIKCAIEATHRIYPQLGSAFRQGLPDGRRMLNRKFLICTDSSQALHVVANPNGSKDGGDTPVVEAIRALKEVMESEIVWVAGHSFNLYNILADALAKAARKKAELSVSGGSPSKIEKALSPFEREVTKLTSDLEEFLASEKLVRQDAMDRSAVSMSGVEDQEAAGVLAVPEERVIAPLAVHHAPSGTVAVPVVHALNIMLTTFIRPPYCTWTLVFDDGREPLIQTTQNPAATHVSLLLDAVQILSPVLSGHRGEAVLHVLREEHREYLSKAPELLPGDVHLHAGHSWVR